MGRRRQAREIALQALYLLDISSSMGTEEALLSAGGALCLENGGHKETCDFAREIVAGARRLQEKIDGRIEAAAENWRISRMAAVDRNVLRLAAYELLFCPQVPAKVAIDEAIEIARKFSTEESTKFINGVLDKIKKGAQAAG